MPLTDSVFSPALRFADDLLMPLAEIEAAQQRLEDAGTAALVEILEAETDSLLRRAETALTNGDLPALLALQWPAAGMMARAIVRIWSDGFGVGAEHGITEMRNAVADLVPVAMSRRFALADDMTQVLTLDANQLINTDAVEAVLGRSNMLAGNFADDTFNALRKDLIAAISPQLGTGNPISRRELLERIQKTLSVGANRAESIAITETDYAYNTGRLNSFKQSELVDYVRVITIDDTRRSEICRDRNGLIVPKNDLSAIDGSPPWHVRCRSSLSAVMSRLSRFQEMVSDPANDPANRSLAPLPTGWRTGATPPPTALTLYPTQLPANHVISDDSRITRDSLNGALTRLATSTPASAERVGKLRQIVESGGLQSVFRDEALTASQLAANRMQIIGQFDGTNSTVIQQLKDGIKWLGKNQGSPNYARLQAAFLEAAKARVDNIKGAGGYNFMSNSRHIVVRTNTTKSLSISWEDFNPAMAAQWSYGTLSKARAATRPSELIKVTGVGYDYGHPAKEMGIYLHEMGHQVHALAGTIDPPATMALVSRYAGTVDLRDGKLKEKVAESFSLFMMDGEAYQQFDPVGYQWLSDLMDVALANLGVQP